MSPLDSIPAYDDDYLQPNDLAGLKAPPNSVEAEQAVIGALLISHTAFDAIGDMIVSGDFYRADHAAAFSAIASLAEAGKPHDVITVHDTLVSTDQLERAGGIGYLFELANNTASAANIRAYAGVIRERSILRALVGASATIADMAYAPQGRAAAEILDESQAVLMALGDRDGGDEKDLSTASTLKQYVAELERRFEADGCVGLPTGFDGLDRRTHGLQGGDLFVIGGRPKSGKTTYAMNIAENVAVKQGKPVLVFSMEMSRIQLIDRMVASLGSIPFDLLRSGKVLSTDARSAISPAVIKIKEAPLYIDDRPAQTIAQMRSVARRQHRKTPLALIVVDYIQLARSKEESRVMEITRISQGLKALAKELNCPVVALSQLSRDCEKEKRRPRASDLRDSGSIEQDADGILLIYRDKVYNEDSHMGDTAEIIIPALRNGEAGIEYLDANLAMCRFENKKHPYSPPSAPPPSNYRKSRSFE